ncbi:MAG: glycosyltransferase, partial [Bacteroidota bacterium]|nr:glycosyltransferase [Bacteroidota bacterium]
MKIIFIGNYPPRKCGIATFTENMVNAIFLAGCIRKRKIDIEVIAMNEEGKEYDYPSIVTKIIHDHNREEYQTISHYINNSGADICIVQHEYGIFGGTAGLFLLPLLKEIQIPIVTTFHTILQKPGFHQKEVLKKIAEYSEKVIVMSSLAIDFMRESFDIPLHKIVRIEHGVPDFKACKSKGIKKPETWKKKKVMMTFGLIGRSKGIDSVIRAMPEIVKQNPDIHYVILGKTHPHIIQHEGEEYREYLKKLSVDLKVENNIEFIDKYVDEDELCNYLLSTDLYVTPYQNKAQITSGTLSYAVASGAAVLSTPYWHAEELLADGRGIFFDFGNYHQLANAANSLLNKPEKLKALQINAFSYGQSISWKRIGNQYIDVCESAILRDKFDEKQIAFSNFKLPDFDFSHIERLSDSTGIIQHGKYCIPDYNTGYCLDDVSRALMLSIMAFKRFGDEKYSKYIWRYISFLMYMQNPAGDFKNFLKYNHDTIEEKGSDDSFGRTIWVLGYIVRYAPTDSVFDLTVDLFAKSAGKISELEYA